MITMLVECSNCYGLGRMHTAGHNGDPMDRGMDCPVCKGAGVVETDVDDSDED